MRLSISQAALLSRLLDEALRLDADGRRAWLERLSPEYQDLAEALRQALLPETSQGASPDKLLTLPKLGATTAAPAPAAGDLQAGMRVGPYELIRPLGMGGMAQVWLARRADGAFKREVALKLPTPTHLRADLEQRFARERDILASLEHPHIARFYDAGVDPNGLSYLVLEYVHGKALTDYCDDHRLGIGARIELFLQVLEAVQYAHGKHVIHRDLKPSNILVNESGEVQLLDFGVAKLLEAEEADRTQLTSVYGRALTPDYASPELLRGDPVDARSDVYSLGVVLYEVLVGVRPYRLRSAASVGLLEQAITHVELKKPSTQIEPGAVAARATTTQRLARQLRGDLDAIALKALAKDPSERYPSAAALAEDLQRSLDGKTVRALPARPSDRLRKFVWRNKALFGVSIMAAATVLGALALTDRARWRELLPGSSDQAHTIAVLPLQNLSGDASQEYFADGITDALTTDLARIENLQVISRTSTMQYKSVKKPLPAIARELNANVIVEGSVQRSGNRVRISAQLVQAATDKHLWAQTYERDLNDILALQDQIASSIAHEIEKRLGGPRPLPPGRAASVRPEAYEAYLKANYYFDRFELRKSIDYYGEAIKLDSTYAPAYAHMAQAYSFLAFFGALPPREGWGKVKEAATLSVERDEHSPEGHAALALAKLHFDWDFSGAEHEFSRALQLNPSDADTRHEYAHYLMAVGRLQEAEAESKRAVELDPVGDALKSCLCWHSFAARDYDEAIRLAKRFLTSQPDDPWEHTILGWTYEQKRLPEQAIVEFKRAIEATNGDSFFLAPLGHAYALAGRRADAEQVLNTLLARAKTSYVSPFDIALIYTALGEKDSAFAWLEQAANERSTFLVYSKWDPRLDPLRSDPRFEKVLDLIGFPA